MSVSIIIPVYNKEKLITRAVESCLRQAEVSQIIIINDGSTDDTEKVCLELKDKFSIIDYISFSKNKGPAIARNYGLSNVKQRYFSFLDSDDYYLSNRFTNAMEILNSNESIDGVYGKIKNDYLDDNFRSLNQPEIIEIKNNLDPEGLFEFVISEREIYFAFPSMVLRSKLIDIIGPFDTGFKYGTDTDYIYEVALKCNLVSDNNIYPKMIRTIDGNNYILSEDYNPYTVRNPIVKKWFKKMISEDWNVNINRSILRRYLHVLDIERKTRILNRYIYKVFVITKLFFNYPRLLKKLI